MKMNYKGPSINDVTQIIGVLDPSPNLSVLFVTLWVTPLPLECDIIYGWSLILIQILPKIIAKRSGPLIDLWSQFEVLFFSTRAEVNVCRM